MAGEFLPLLVVTHWRQPCYGLEDLGLQQCGAEFYEIGMEAVPMAGERYALFGLIPTEREVNEPMELDEQNVGDSGDVLIYETDDRDEAGEIYRAGGFERDGKWHAVTRVVDRSKQGDQTIGINPTPSRMPSKRDYDQS